MTTVQYHKLAPNIHIFLTNPERYKTEINIGFSAGGSYFEPENLKGIAHLLEHCAVARTTAYNFDELMSFLFENDIYHNASTGRLFMNFVVAGHRHETSTLLDLILEFALSPTFTPEVLAQEKDIVLREMEQKYGDPRYRLFREVLKQSLEPDSLYLNEILGNSEHIRNASIDSLYTIKNNMVKNSHFILSGIGSDISVDMINEKMGEYMNNLYNNVELPVNFTPDNNLKQFKYLPIVSNLAHDDAWVYIFIPFPVNINTKAQRVFFSELLFNNPIGYLFDTLRNKNGLVYSMGYDFEKAGQVLSLDLTCEVKNVNRVIEEVKEAFLDFDKVFPEDRINMIRDLTIKRQELSEDDPSGVVQEVVDMFTDYGEIIQFHEFIDEVKDTSRDDIKAVFDEVQQGLDKMQVIVVSNNSQINQIRI